MSCIPMTRHLSDFRKVAKLGTSFSLQLVQLILGGTEPGK